MSFARVFRVAMVAAAIAAGVAALRAQPPARRTHLVIVVDGLRPDYVTPDAMPRLVQLGRRGAVFNAHHSVVPTVTRVNAASIATGVYPETAWTQGREPTSKRSPRRTDGC
jgi:hypothetical protein